MGEVTAAATFYMAEVYSDFSRALRESQPPTALDPAELQSYEAAIEEEARPLQEKAIEIHRKNLELLGTGIHNPWIDKSLARLAELMPVQYAKSEASSGLMGSVETYTYRAPVPAAPSADPLVPGGSDASPR